MTLPKDPIKREEYLRKLKELGKLRAQDSVWRANQKAGSQKRSKNPLWKANHTAGARKMAQDPVWQANHNTMVRKLAADPNWQKTNKLMREEMYQDPIWQAKHRSSVQKLAMDQNWKDNNRKSREKMYRDPIWKSNQKLGSQKRSITDEWLLKNMEASVGGFCIQNITYRDPPVYCEFWCPDLWHRIDEAQNYQSILSGKTKSENICRDGKTRALSRHHVYWQPRACCEWDEDIGGYYAWIETGTKKHPNKVKYYIKGDPNKFVLLTASEHMIIRQDKLKWIKIFEELIETKLGGICYLPKDVE